MLMQGTHTVATKATLFIASLRRVGKCANCKSKKFSRVVATKKEIRARRVELYLAPTGKSDQPTALVVGRKWQPPMQLLSRPLPSECSPHPGLPPFWGKENIKPTDSPVGAQPTQPTALVVGL
jgi:hypothetical protein